MQVLVRLGALTLGGCGAAELLSGCSTAEDGGGNATASSQSEEPPARQNERQFESGGRRYWHILDPKTGYPVETELESASILAEESLDGDGFTKPVFMMHPDDGLAWLEDKGLQGIIVTNDGAIRHTSDSRINVLGE